MNGAKPHWIDLAIDHGVAALFALACAFPAVMLLGTYGSPMFAVAGVIALLAFAACRGALNQLGRPRARDFAFELAPLPDFEPLETLELRDPVSPGPAEAELDEPLELADAIEAPAPDSRVVRLFGERQGPTAGDLLQRIDNHLSARGTGQPDQTAAMLDALNDLRRSLR